MKRKIAEMIEEVDEGEMPLSGYVMLHKEAELSEDSRNELISWIRKIDFESEQDSI